MKVDFSSTCRTCMAESLELTSIFHNETHTKLSLCCELQIRHNDGLPEMICKMCVKNAEQAFAFRNRCRESELNLRRIVADSSEKINVKVEPSHLMDVETSAEPEPYQFMKTETLVEEVYFEDEPQYVDDDNYDEGSDYVVEALEPYEMEKSSHVVVKQEKRTKNKKNLVCEVCSKVFTDISTFNRHKLIHKGKTFKCDLCDAAYARSDKLKLHKMKAHAEEYVKEEHNYECNDCGEVFRMKSQLRYHFGKNLCPTTPGEHRTENPAKPYHTCQNCALEFTTEKGLNAHIAKNKCGETTFRCNICNCAFSSHKALNRHSYIHLGEKYECELCDKHFIRPDLLVSHKRKSHGIDEEREFKQDPMFNANEMGEFVCSVCSHVAADSHALKEHYQEHSNIKFKCTICDKEYNRRHDVNRHMKKMHGSESNVTCEFSVVDRPKIEKQDSYECDHCHKVFKQRYKYKEHLITHSDLRPFLCGLCGSSFKTKTSLQMHEMRHTQIRPHKCEECSKAYYTRKDLTVHMRAHTGEKPYQCTECGASYTRSDSLALHFRKHTGERPHACEYCPKRFTKREKLKIHTRIHTGERPYACVICDQRFTQKYDMIKHTRRHQEHQQAPARQQMQQEVQHQIQIQQAQQQMEPIIVT